MADPQLGDIIDRLKANLRGAGIGLTEADVEAMAEKGYLKQVLIFEQSMKGSPDGLVPDYLAISDLADSDRAGRDGRKTGKEAGNEADIASPGKPRAPRGESSNREWCDAPPGEVMEAGVHALSVLLQKAALSPVELVEKSLARMGERGEELNAFQLRLDEEARAAARAAEKELRGGSWRGPLHGIPVAVKDNLDLAGSPTTAGSTILGGKVAERDSTAVAKLKAAGAIIVGKTRMAEFAYSPGSNNDHFGPTKNPWGLDRDTGGSSSGSAAAVAGRMVTAALGTDTGGSIRIPASFCGLVGLKPTFGRLSLAGSVSLSWSLDHLGPLTRSVEDAAILLDALSGPDPRDPRTGKPAEGLPARASSAHWPIAPELAERAECGLSGLRVGVLREDGTGKALATDEALAAWKAGLAVLEKAGAELVEVDLPELQAARAFNSTLLAIEAVAFHAPLMRESLSGYGEFTRHRLLAGWAYSPADFVRVQQGRMWVRRRCEAIFARVDLLSTPTMPSEAPSLGTPARLVFTSPFNLLGWPAISIPAGRTAAGLPLGLQLLGKPWDEATLLLAAKVAEEGIAFS